MEHHWLLRTLLRTRAAYTRHVTVVYLHAECVQTDTPVPVMSMLNALKMFGYILKSCQLEAIRSITHLDHNL